MYQFGLIGHPVQHSKSPDIHQYYLDISQQAGTYKLFDVFEEDLGAFLYDLRHSSMDGVNVTVPYKEKVIPYLDDMDSNAKVLKSVNTIKIKENRLIGYNTDGEGYIESLYRSYPKFIKEINQQSILIIGAGGAAKGIYYSLKKLNPKTIDVANRTRSKASDIISGNSVHRALDLVTAEQNLSDYDLIIHTTTVGMEPDVQNQIISLEHLTKGTIVSDIVYKPKWTNFLLDGKNHGAKLLFGESMLWYQAAKSFKIWTGRSVEESLQNLF